MEPPADLFSYVGPQRRSGVRQVLRYVPQAIGESNLETAWPSWGMRGKPSSPAESSLFVSALLMRRERPIQAGMTVANFVQYDSLIGPGPDIVERRKPDRACYCQEKATRIARVRATRVAQPDRPSI
jgi:hypothetical protein